MLPSSMAAQRLAVLSKHFLTYDRLVALPCWVPTPTAALTNAETDEFAFSEPCINYQSGLFRPVVEEADNVECVVEGQIPTDLDGIFFRNGPNPKFAPTENDTYHYFDGDGMIVKVDISSGKATFTHKWVRTERFQDDQRQGSSVYEFGAMAVGKPQYDKVMNSEGLRMGKANTSIVFHHGKLLALEEGDQPYHISVDTLETIGKNRFQETLDSNVFTAHPHIDPDTKEMIGYGFNLSPGEPLWSYRVVGSDGKVSTAFDIPLRNTTYNHDFAITKNNSIVFDGNLCMNWKNIMAGKGAWDFRRDIPGRIGVFPRHAKSNAEVKWFDVKPFCVSHTINAFDDGDEIVVICNNIGFEEFKPGFSVETPQDPDANLHEWRLNVRTGLVKECMLRHLRSDFGQYNWAYTGRRFRYVYSQHVDYDEPHHCPYVFGCYKFDLQTKTYKEQFHGEKFSCNGGETVFVPRPNATDEDDGYLLLILTCSKKRRSELVIYDARTFGDPGNEVLCRIILPKRVIPLGTHGLWMTRQEAKGAVNK